MKSLLKIFIFFAPFTVYLALSGWFRLPVMIALFLIISSVFYFIKRKSINLKFLAVEDIFLMFILILVMLSLAFNFYGPRAVNHTLAYFFAFFIYYFFIKLLVVNTDLKATEMEKTIYYSFITISIIIIIDTIGKNLDLFELRKILVKDDPSITRVTYYIRNGIYNSAGVSEEPGNMAFFYNIYFTAALLYRHYLKKNFYGIIVLFLVCQFFLFSAAGIALPIFSFLILLNISLLKKSKLYLFGPILALGLVTFFVLTWEKSGKILINMLQKLFFVEPEGVTSSGARLNQWSRAFSNTFEKPLFGKGPGFGVQEDSEGYLSIYFTIMADLGIFAFFCIILYLASILLKIYNIKGMTANILMFGALSMFGHMAIISDFYHAPVWLFFILIQLIYNEKRDRNFY